MSSQIYSFPLRFIHCVYTACSMILLSSCASESSSEMAKFALTQPVDAPIVEFDQSVTGTFKTADSIVLLTLSHAFNTSDKKIGIRLAESQSRVIINKREIVNHLDGTIYAKIDSTSDELKARGKTPLKDYLISQLDSLLRSICKHPYTRYSNPKFEGDFFYIHVSLTDTLFAQSNKRVIKKMKNDFYLNFQEQDLFVWKVLQISPKGKGVVVSSMSDEDAYVLRRIIKMEKNPKPDNNILNPDMESFKKFVELKGFENQVELERL